METMLKAIMTAAQPIHISTQEFLGGTHSIAKEFANHTKEHVRSRLIDRRGEFYGELLPGRNIQEIIKIVAKAFQKRLPKYKDNESPVIHIEVHQKPANGKTVVGILIKTLNFEPFDPKKLESIWHGTPMAIADRQKQQMPLETTKTDARKENRPTPPIIRPISPPRKPKSPSSTDRRGHFFDGSA
ncbi:hypothetical protein HY994_04490 [Candidatus Micrarchaeota archaeon]|nr:hypothetical protein [Candidatus Micrarchaeota archaeon]